MARESKTKTIDGEQYTFYQINPRQSMKCLTRIIKLIGGPMGLGMDTNGLDNSKDIEDILGSNVNIGVIVSGICDRLDDDNVEYIIDTLLSQTIHKGKGEVSKSFDELFAGKLPHLFKVVFAAMEVEYGDFFGGKLDFLKIFKKASINPESAT